ncbi:MAG: flagellin lysine-N-methylase [Lachnospiraceae bacterium]|nr:flagellin lysine-N-methylase [Lachnospiraceae bacterium]
MEFRMPSYYNQFKCIADKCPDTCCAGWAIVIDDKTIETYKDLTGEAGEYVRDKVDFEEGIYKRHGERCAFLNDCNLCDLIINQGEDKLCKTCTRYPRHFEEYGDLVEAALSMSCPVAAGLIINNPDKDRFKCRVDETKNKGEKVDKKLLDVLLKVRKLIFSITGDRTKSIDQRMKEILLLTEKVQPLIFDYEKLGAKRRLSAFSKGIFQKLDEILDKCQHDLSQRALSQDDGKNGKTKLSKKKKNNYIVLRQSEDRSQEDNNMGYQLMKEYIDMFLGLENINEDWPKTMGEIISLLYHRHTPEEYKSLKSEFVSAMKAREYEYEHILNYFIYTYFLGGIYDYNILGMVKLAVVSTLIIREMGMAKWLQNEKELRVEHQLKCAYSYSRQVEHSEDNQLAFEGILTAHPKFETENIISTLEL